MTASDSPEILIVEDNRLTRKLLARQLQAGGFRVIEADSAGAALALFSQRKPALVTIDLQLGDRRGEEVVEEILARDPEAKIVVITAEAPSDARKSLLARGKGYVQKPLLDPELVLTEIRKALADKAPSGDISRFFISAPAARAVVHYVLESTMGIETTDSSPEILDSPPGALTAYSHVTGGWEGTIFLQCDHALLRELAVRLFHLDAEVLASEDLADALSEIANIIVGNLKSTLPANCNHSLPEVTRGPTSLDDTLELKRCWFTTHHGNLLLAIAPAVCAVSPA